jgi:poly-gamma-glutamate synthesis protein (capsule biosynthesis protein)
VRERITKNLSNIRKKKLKLKNPDKKVWLLVLVLISFWLALLILNLLGILVPADQSSIGWNWRLIPPVESENTVIIPTSKDKISIVIGGDTMLGQDIGEGIRGGHNPFQHLRGFLDSFDLTVLNLETALAEDHIGSPQPKAHTFKAPPEAAAKLKSVGVDMVSLANNHAVDYGPEALLNGIGLLHQQGISVFGAGANFDQAFSPSFAVIGDTTIAFISVNDGEPYYNSVRSNRAGTAFFDYNLINGAISGAKKYADVIIIFPHWGNEHQTSPNSEQVRWGRTFIDLGADLVVGAHPHVRQTIEPYKGKKIFYSLGNFVFSGMSWNPEALKGSLLEIAIEDKKITGTGLHTIQIDGYGYPHLVE